MNYPDVTNDDYVVLWAIYDHPADYPHGFVVRKSYVKHGAVVIDPECQRVPSLSKARMLIPRGLVNIGRMLDDDPTLYEVWI